LPKRRRKILKKIALNTAYKATGLGGLQNRWRYFEEWL